MLDTYCGPRDVTAELNVRAQELGLLFQMGLIEEADLCLTDLLILSDLANRFF